MSILDNYKKILQDYKTKVIDEVKERVLGRSEETLEEEVHNESPYGLFITSFNDMSFKVRFQHGKLFNAKNKKDVINYPTEWLKNASLKTQEQLNTIRKLDDYAKSIIDFLASQEKVYVYIELYEKMTDKGWVVSGLAGDTHIGFHHFPFLQWELLNTDEYTNYYDITNKEGKRVGFTNVESIMCDEIWSCYTLTTNTSNNDFFFPEYLYDRKKIGETPIYIKIGDELSYDNSIPMEELDAVNFSNRTRLKMGEKGLRTSYGGRLIPKEYLHNEAMLRKKFRADQGKEMKGFIITPNKRDKELNEREW